MLHTIHAITLIQSQNHFRIAARSKHNAIGREPIAQRAKIVNLTIKSNPVAFVSAAPCSLLSAVCCVPFALCASLLSLCPVLAYAHWLMTSRAKVENRKSGVGEAATPIVGDEKPTIIRTSMTKGRLHGT